MLDVFGLSMEAESVYRAMLASPSSEPRDLALATAQDRADVDTALAELRAAGIVVAGAGGDEPLPPEQAVEALIAREQQVLAERLRRLDAQRTGVDDLVKTFVEARRTEESAGTIERIRDKGAVRARLYELQKATQHSCWSMHGGGVLSPQAIQSGQRLDRESQARGVDLRSIVSELALGDEPNRAYLRDSVSTGGQVRVYPTPPMSMILIDEEVSVIPDGDSGGAVILHGRDLSLPVRRLFDETWAAATPLGEWLQAGLDGDQRQARSRQVVSLLAQGMTDEAIARRLGVSVRTVGRMIAAATDALGASSRFQAGVLAVQKGWVAPRPRGVEHSVG